MDLARYVVDAVVVEGRGIREVARAHGVSKSWVSVLVARFRLGGYEALAPRSKAPHRSPQRTPVEVEDYIVELRKHLGELGVDNGPRTIAWHLERSGLAVPAESTISAILRRRGFVIAQPAKRPRNSFIRFEAALPNECWQADPTHWALAGGEEVEILDVLDDHSRLCVASVAVLVMTSPAVVEIFHGAAQRWGYPASVLTDNGAIFNAAVRHGSLTVFQTELESLGIVYKHSRPYHPQTCGKVERFHQTLKKYLAKQRRARTLAGLQAQLDRFVEYYNHSRPHRARDRATPYEAFMARDRAGPGTPVAPVHFRVRTDRVDDYGNVTLRHDGKLLHIGVGRPFKGARIHLYVADLDVRIVTFDGELLRHLTIDPARIYQGRDREAD
jgi:transposase InsO family protein